MPRAKPKVQRTCLVCSSSFQGTPAATRCDACKDAGRKVPREVQQARRKLPQKPRPSRATKPRVLHDKLCHACGTEFTTHKAKASRCDRCIAEDRPVKRRRCLECREWMPVLDDAQVNCEPCAEALGVEVTEMTPEQIERQIAEERKQRAKERIARQAAWLDEREKRTPKGTRMTTAVRSKPIGQMWLQVCAHDGAAHVLTYAGATADLTEDQKITLLTSYAKLRLKRYRPEQIERLCPVALLKEAAQCALSDLPEAPAEDPNIDPTEDPYVGLSDAQRSEVIYFTEAAQRRRDRIALGLE